jgi:phage anti-repressor protein/phage antirepressor YoqD-like protein
MSNTTTMGNLVFTEGISKTNTLTLNEGIEAIGKTDSLINISKNDVNIKPQLRLIKNGLIPVFENDKNLEVSSEDLYQQLQIRKDKSSWMKAQIEKLELAENIDFRILTQKGINKLGGGLKKIYYFPIDIAKEIAIISQTKMGKVIRKYFLEVEKEYRQAHAENPLIGKSPLELLEYTVVELKKKELIIQEQAQQIETMKPVMQFVDDFFKEDVNDISFNTMAKLSKLTNPITGKYIGGRTLKDICVKQGICNPKDRTPNQLYVNKGYFKIIYTQKWFDGCLNKLATSLITPKGQRWLYNRLSNVLSSVA